VKRTPTHETERALITGLREVGTERAGFSSRVSVRNVLIKAIDAYWPNGELQR